MQRSSFSLCQHFIFVFGFHRYRKVLNLFKIIKSDDTHVNHISAHAYVDCIVRHLKYFTRRCMLLSHLSFLTSIAYSLLLMQFM